MTLLRKLAARFRPAAGVRGIPATPDVEAAEWATRHYPGEKERRLAARFALILEAQINRPVGEFAPTSRFYEELKMHDLEPVEVLMAIEREFQIEVPREKAAAMQTIKDVVDYLAARVVAEPTPKSAAAVAGARFGAGGSGGRLSAADAHNSETQS
jgi:acyl carrier protein